MGIHEDTGKSDEWYTPKYVFDALGAEFDLDVAHPQSKTNVPATKIITENSLVKKWEGFVWMNPPFGGRNGLQAWINKFIEHGNGIMLTPDRTSCPRWQFASENTDAVLFVKGKIKFIKPDGSTGDSPANGTSLFAIGKKGVDALRKAHKNGLGKLYLNPQH